MPRMLRLTAPVRVSHSFNTDDVVSVKRALSDLGLYDPPGPLHGALDSGVLNGIEAFQRMNGLHIDREVAPGGETERAMNEQLSAGGPREVPSNDETKGGAKRPKQAILAMGLPDPGEPPQGRNSALQLTQDAGPANGGSAVPPPALTPRREPLPPPPPAMTPERQLPPPRTAHFPPLDPPEPGRRQGLALAGEPVEHNLGERLLRMSPIAARAEAERIANQPIPEWKSESLEPAHWAVWADALDRAPEIGPVQRAVYLEIFAAEGGFKPDGSTVAGIASVTDIAPAIGVPKDTPPAELTVAQLVDSYPAYFDLGYSLGPIGGAATLEAMQDIGVATALADALFRHGPTGGADILRKAINDIDPGRVPENGRMDQALFDAYVALAADPATRPALGVAVTAFRNEDRPDETRRNRRMGEEMLQ